MVRALNGFLPAPTEIAGELARLLATPACPTCSSASSRCRPRPSSCRTIRSSSRLAGRRDPERRQGDRVDVRRPVARDRLRRRPRLRGHERPRRRRRRRRSGSPAEDRRLRRGTGPRSTRSSTSRCSTRRSSTAPALALRVGRPDRAAALGATFGFPGGGALDVQPAAVAGAYTRPGRDIYGKTRVTRSILEIRAEIDQGDSGGPLVLADGTVGGVVFAEARTDEEVGYALTPRRSASAIAPSLGRYRLGRHRRPASTESVARIHLRPHRPAPILVLP